MNPNPPAVHYARCADTIARRLRVLDTIGSGATYLDAELTALHLSKIVEVVASAAECVAGKAYKPSGDRGTQDAARVLTELHKQHLLVLPKAEDITTSDQPGFALVVSGAQVRDLGVADLKQAYRASTEFLGETSPEAIDAERLGRILTDLRTWAGRLRGWLWNHAMFLEDQALIVQMGMLDTESFIATLRKDAVNRPLTREVACHDHGFL